MVITNFNFIPFKIGNFDRINTKLTFSQTLSILCVRMHNYDYILFLQSKKLELKDYSIFIYKLSDKKTVDNIIFKNKIVTVLTKIFFKPLLLAIQYSKT